MSRIASFGSCLSENVAEIVGARMGLRFSSRVIHNRSDYFVETFLRRRNRLPNLESLLSDCRAGESASLIEQAHRSQARDTLGVFDAGEDEPFLRQLRTGALDVIVVDNVSDVVADLLLERETGRFFFSDPDWFAPDAVARRFDLRPRPSAEESFSAFIHVLRYFRTESPESRILFLCCPAAPYDLTSGVVERRRAFADVVRTQREKLVSAIPQVTFLAPPEVAPPEVERGVAGEGPHFSRAYYLRLSDAVYELLSSSEEPRSGTQLKAVLGVEERLRVDARRADGQAS